MALSEFGHLVRTLRSQIKTSLRHMAEHIGVSPSYLSAVEVGIKNPTDDLVRSAAAYFRDYKGIKASQIVALYATAARTKRVVDVSGLDRHGREAVATFARKWLEMDEHSRAKFLRDVAAVPKEKTK